MAGFRIKPRSKKTTKRFSTRKGITGAQVKRAATRTKISRQLNNDFALPGMNSSKVVKMLYHTQGQLVSTTATQNIWNFKMNDIFDPDVTGVGHQPYGHDQWGLYYKNYTVIGAKINAQFSWASAKGPTGAVCGIIADDNTSLPSTLQTKQERYPGCMKNLVANSNGMVSVDAYYSMKKFFHQKDLDSHQHITGFGSSPFLPAYFNIFVQSTDGGTTSNPIHLDISIEYTVRMLDPHDTLGS